MKKRLSALLALMLIASMAFGAVAEEKAISDYTVVMIVKQSDPWFDDFGFGQGAAAAVEEE